MTTPDTTENPQPPKLPAGYILCRTEDTGFLAEWVKYMTVAGFEVRTTAHRDDDGKVLNVEGVAE